MVLRILMVTMFKAEIDFLHSDDAASGDPQADVDARVVAFADARAADPGSGRH